MTFALAGVGFVAPKHLQAIKEFGELVAAYDVRDSVGILDSYFPSAEFFTDADEFEEYIKGVDYLVICTPNYTHLDFLKMGERINAETICEKPLVLNVNELDQFKDSNVILQLRLHPELDKICGDKVNIEYITPRGKWYHKSWKGNKNLSGGLLLNIGIHLFDLMIYKFGKPHDSELYHWAGTSAKGRFFAGDTEINWHLSLIGDKIIRDINGIDLSNTKDLHIKSYEKILSGQGFKKKDIYLTTKLINDTQDS